MTCSDEDLENDAVVTAVDDGERGADQFAEKKTTQTAAHLFILRRSHYAN